jgi:hypothetical protein
MSSLSEAMQGVKPSRRHTVTSCCVRFMVMMLDRKLTVKATEVATKRREE